MYALVTPAKNEERYLERTIQSVIRQTVRPLRWVIVDDGSSDRTASIAESYAQCHDWIAVVRRDAGASRDFASKTRSFVAGCEKLRDLAYEYLGNLDADISFAPDYYERILEYFRKDMRLGIAGGKFQEIAKDGRIYPVRCSADSVRGAVQMFRRQCYEDVGGYRSLPRGGIDAAAEVMARMKGWKVCSFPDLTILHLRPTSDGMRSPLGALVRRGFQDRSLGYGGLFEAVRCAARIGEPPFLLGGLSVLLGYSWSWIRGDGPALPKDTTVFLRREQRAKLVRILRGIFRLKTTSHVTISS